MVFKSRYGKRKREFLRKEIIYLPIPKGTPCPGKDFRAFTTKYDWQHFERDPEGNITHQYTATKKFWKRLKKPCPKEESPYPPGLSW